MTDPLVAATDVPAYRPLLPSAEAIRPYLERIDRTRWYTNFGPLLAEFEERLAAHFDVEHNQIATAANGTLALGASLATSEPSTGEHVPIPDWTFPGTAFAVLGAGLRPYLCDVEQRTWSIDVSSAPAALLHESRALVAVAPFGTVKELDGWVSSAERVSVPLIVDAAASFDQLSGAGVPRGAPAMLMVSLHATKSLGVGEGAVVMSNDPAWIERFRRYINFGFSAARRADSLGTNAKLPEYSAAVGLAALDGWLEARAQWLRTTEVFASGLRALGVGAQPGFAEGTVSPYCIADFETPTRCTAAINALAAAGIESRRWWGMGLHSNPALSDLSHGDLQNTRAIAERTLGLPFWQDIGEHTTERIFTTLGAAVRGS